MYFRVWVVTLSDAYHERLVGRLISHGWTIGCSGGKLTYGDDEHLSCILTFSMKKDGDAPHSSQTVIIVREEIISTMQLLEMHFLGIVVAIDVNTAYAWSSSNVKHSPDGTDHLDQKIFH